MERNMCEGAMEEAVSLFDSIMHKELQGRLPVDMEELECVYTDASTQAMNLYLEGAPPNDAEIYTKLLLETLPKKFQSHIEANNSISKHKCQNLITSLWKDIEHRYLCGTYKAPGGYAKYKEERKKAEAEYSSTANLGPKKENVLTKFLQEKEAQAKEIDISEARQVQSVKYQQYKRSMDAAKAESVKQKHEMQVCLVEKEAHQKMPVLGQADVKHQEAINKGAAPCITSTVELMERNKCKGAMKEAVSLFDSIMHEKLQGRLPVDMGELKCVYTGAYTQAMDVYSKGAPLHGAEIYTIKLRETLCKKFQSHIEANDSISEHKCQDLLTMHWKDIEKKYLCGTYKAREGYAEYKEDTEMVQALYYSTTNLGPKKESVLTKFLGEKEAQAKEISEAHQAYSVKDQQPQKEKMSIDRTKADSVEQKSEMPEVEEAAHPNLKHQETVGGPDMEAPLWFIKTDKHGQMSVNKDVAHVLAQAEGSIGVIAIVVGAPSGASSELESLVQKLTEHIKVKDSKEEEGTQFKEYFPFLFLLLRDFYLEISIDGKNRTPDQYMENALKLREGCSKRTADYNEPRRCILDFFPNRKCFVLCKPVDDDAKIKKLEAVDEQEIKPKFLAQAKEATDAILKKAKSMRVDRYLINGSRFMELAETYVKCMNEGGVPCISTAVELLKNNECQRALESALAVFEQKMKEQLESRVPVENDIIEEIQIAAHQAAMDTYKRGALFDKEGKYITKLMEQLEKRYKEFQAQYIEASFAACKQALSEAFRQHQEKFIEEKYLRVGGYKLYKQDREAAVRKYNQIPKKGPMAKQALNEYLELKSSEKKNVINTDKTLTENDKKLALESEERKRQQKRTEILEQEQMQLKKDCQRQQEEQEKMMKDIQKELESQQEKHKEEMKEMKAEQERLRSEGLEEQAQKYQSQIDHVEKKYQEQEQENRKIIKQQEESMKQVAERRNAEMQARMEFLEAEKESTGFFGYIGKAFDVPIRAVSKAVKHIFT